MIFQCIKSVTNILNRTTSQTCHQHIWSPTSVTNINVTNFILIFLFSLDEKEIFIDGKPEDNWLKNDFNEEYTLDISDVKFVSEKGFFHLFGELFVTEINFVRNEAPDKTECVLSMGKQAGKSTCPEHESFQNLS